jgi:hypothetical protein
MKIRIKKKKQLIYLFFLIPAIMLTLAGLTQPQRTIQFAQEMFTDPPLFGCLQVGEGNASTCASKLGRAISQALTLHGKPVEKKTVYYGDTVTGSLEFINVGDLPINISYIGLVGQSQQEKNYFVDFLPATQQTAIAPGQSVKMNDAKYKFNSPDPNGEWFVTSDVEDSAGNKAQSEDKKTTFTVNATCTALRAKELTDKDKSNLEALCSKNPKSKLCSSRQYCEIFKGENCTASNVSEETPKWQCDEYVYLPKPEQDLLEELCKVYPDTDACKNFCDRSIGSSLCPDKYLFVDTISGKAVTYFHPRVLYVRKPDEFTFAYSKDYPTDRVKMSAINQQTAVAGIGTSNLIAQLGCTPQEVSAGVCKPAPAVVVPPPAKCPAGQTLMQGGRCSGAAVPVAPKPAAPKPAAKCPAGQTLMQGGRCSGAAVPVAPKPAASGMTNNGCTPQEVSAGVCKKASPAIIIPPPPPPCPAPKIRLRSGSCGLCEPGDIQCEANKQKELSANCPKGTTGGAYVPGEGCRTLPPPPPATPVKAPPPACGVPGQPKCNLEKNNTPPDPIKGRIADPNTCNPDGTPKPPALKCTSLTIPETAVNGDVGYAKNCKSSRQDGNPNDDPPGAAQFACCANSLSLREGCCGQACTVWSQKAQPNGTITYRDGIGKVCANTPGANNAVLNSNTCGPQTKTNPQAQRAKVIPPNLEGTSGQNPPVGFIPQQPGTLNSTCDVNRSGSCGSGLTCKVLGTGRTGACQPSEGAPPAGPAAPVNNPPATSPPAQQVSGCNYSCNKNESCTEGVCPERKFRPEIQQGDNFCGLTPAGKTYSCVTADYPDCINNKCAAKLNPPPGGNQPVVMPQVNPKLQACIDQQKVILEQCKDRCKNLSTGICPSAESTSCTKIANDNIAACKLANP